MIDSRKYLANQIRGPIATALLQGAWDVHAEHEDYFKYLEEFSLEEGKVTTETLNDLGVILGVSRPYSTYGDDNAFLLPFPDLPYSVAWRMAHALSSVRMPWGGVLSNEFREHTVVPVSDLTYLTYMRNTVAMRQSPSLQNILQTVLDLVSDALEAGQDPNNYFQVSFVKENKNDILVELHTIFLQYIPYLNAAFAITFTTAPRVSVQIGGW